MDLPVLIIFGLVYLGMMLGELPGLALDRTGVALLGAIALVAFGRVTTQQALLSVDLPTMALLFGLMVVSAQLRLGGFYTAVTQRIAAAPLSPVQLVVARARGSGYPQGCGAIGDGGRDVEPEVRSCHTHTVICRATG